MNILETPQDVWQRVFTFCNAAEFLLSYSRVCKSWNESASKIAAQHYLKKHVEDSAQPFLSMLPEGQDLASCCPDYAKLKKSSFSLEEMKKAINGIMIRSNISVYRSYVVKPPFTENNLDERDKQIIGKAFSCLCKGSTLNFYSVQDFDLFPINLFNLNLVDENAKASEGIAGNFFEGKTIIVVKGKLHELTLCANDHTFPKTVFTNRLDAMFKAVNKCFIPALDANAD